MDSSTKNGEPSRISQRNSGAAFRLRFKQAGGGRGSRKDAKIAKGIPDFLTFLAAWREEDWFVTRRL